MKRRTVVVEGPLAFRMRRLAARRTLHTWTEEVRSAAAD